MKSDVRLTYTDAGFLSVISQLGKHSRGISLIDLIDSYDFENREIPGYDETSYGLARLVARGYATTSLSTAGELRVFATDAARKLRRDASQYRKETSRHRWPRIGEYTAAIAHLLDIPDPWQEQPDDRTAGRLPNLNETDLARVNETRRRQFDGFMRRTAWVDRLLRRYMNWRRPGSIMDADAPDDLS